MKNHLSALLAMTATFLFSANGQETQPTRVVEVIPEQTMSITTPDSIVTEIIPGQVIPGQVIPGQVITVTEITPAPAATSTNYENTIAVQGLDPTVARRHLSVAPQAVNVTPEQRTALDHTVIIESRPEPVRRFYNVERNVVIVEEQGESRELAYLTVPVLFVVDTADLLDAESRMALEQTASVINEIAQTEPNALFDVEGHTSTEGSAEHNMRLSAERSKRIYDELTQRYGVPKSALTAHGYGQNFPMYPEGTELERQEDRRVLVVRTR